MTDRNRRPSTRGELPYRSQRLPAEQQTNIGHRQTFVEPSDERVPRTALASQGSQRSSSNIAVADYNAGSALVARHDQSSRTYVPTPRPTTQTSRQYSGDIGQRSVNSQPSLRGAVPRATQGGSSGPDVGRYQRSRTAGPEHDSESSNAITPLQPSISRTVGANSQQYETREPEDRRHQRAPPTTSATTHTRERPGPVTARLSSYSNGRDRTSQPGISREPATRRASIDPSDRGVATDRQPPPSSFPGTRPSAARYSIPGESTVAPADGPRLDGRYSVKNSGFYKVGRVFSVLWHAPFTSPQSRNGQPIARDTYMSDNVCVSIGPYGEPIYSTPRRMVVVREDHGHCVCLQVNTYAGRGLKKFGRQNQRDVDAHSIIHMDDSNPVWLPGEPESWKRNIAVRKANGHKLDPASRLCYSRPHTVEHTVKSMEIGMVTEESLPYLQNYYQQQNNVG